MSAVKEEYYDCSFVSIHYIICECGKTFPSENDLRAHLEKEHPHKRERKEFKCGVCGLIFSTEQDCICHYEAEHFSDMDIKQEQGQEEEEKPNVLGETGDDQEIEQVVFQMDGQDSQEYEDFADHQDYQEEIQEESHVSHEEMSQDEMQEEMLSQEDMAQDVSQNVTVAETRQATRILVKANGNKEYPTVRAPPLKMVRDADTGQLVLVFNRARPLRRQAAARPSRPASKHIVCEVCGRKYASNAALRYHQRAHTGEKPYHCHLCPKQFTMPLFLQIHVRTHTGERPFQCPECPKAFSNKAALLRHERVHTGVKPYVCPMCYKAFTQSNSMKLHVATVHLKQPAPYKSRARRLKDAARGEKQPAKIKAFAPAGSVITTLESAGNDAKFEFVISEDAEDPDGTSIEYHEIVYEGEE